MYEISNRTNKQLSNLCKSLVSQSDIFQNFVRQIVNRGVLDEFQGYQDIQDGFYETRDRVGLK